MWDIHKSFRLIWLEIEYFQVEAVWYIFWPINEAIYVKDHFADTPKQESQGLIIHNIEGISLVGNFTGGSCAIPILAYQRRNLPINRLLRWYTGTGITRIDNSQHWNNFTG